jgi:dipeptidyl aminopeptidase/acylaminoacyl peptidase
MSGLREAFDEIVADVPVYGDLDRAIEQADRERRHRQGMIAGLAAAAAVAAVIVGALAVTRDANDSPEPTGPSSPTSSPTGSQQAKPDLGPAIYFDALAVEGDSLSDPAHNIAGPKDIYLTREGGTAQQLVATRADEYCPRVSPEGDMLAYLEGTTVVVRRLDANGLPGATTARVQHSPASTDGLACPQWSPRGGQLAVAVDGFDDESYEQNFEVRVIDADGGTERVVAQPQAQFMPLSEIAWSPAGDAIAYRTADSVWIAPVDGGEPRRLWQGRTSTSAIPSGFPPYPGMPDRLAWLATGELAVTAQTDVDGRYAQHIVDAVSGHDEVIGTFPMESTWGWSWSPDGLRLVFADTDGTEQLLDRVSGTTVPIRPRLLGHVLPIWKLSWSPDGRRLVGTAGNPDPSADLGFGLVSMDPDGGSVKVLSPWTLALYSEADASWSPR